MRQFWRASCWNHSLRTLRQLSVAVRQLEVLTKAAQSGMNVTVIERGRVGCEASRAAAGMLSPQGGAESGGPFFDLCLQSRAMYRKFGEQLAEASGIDIEYKDEGTLFVVVEGEDQEEKTRWASWQLEAGLSLEHLSADEVHKFEPAVTQSATRAIFLPQEHQVENRRLMDALEVAIKGAGYLLSAATQIVPSLEGFELVEAWSGLRPDTVDHLPVLGPSGIDNLFLGTGHFRNGILLAPATAAHIAEAIMTGRQPKEIAALGVERFQSGRPQAAQ